MWDGNGDASRLERARRASRWACSQHVRLGRGEVDPPPAAAAEPPGRRSTSASRTRATSASTSPSSASRLFECLLRHRLAHPARRAAGARAGRDEPRAGARASRRSTSSHSQGWGTKQLTDGRITSPGYMSRQLDHAGRQPVEVGAGRPRLGPALQQGRALSAHRRADARRARSRTSRSTSRSARRHLDHADDGDQDRRRPAEPARPRPRQPAADLRQARSRAAKTVAKARLYVAGLGAYEATVNGKPRSPTPC